MARFLQRHGWSLAREGSRHTVFSKGGSQVAVPRHGPLKTGTLAAILKQASIDDWEHL